MKGAKRNLIKVVQKAVQIMKILVNSSQPMGVNELGKLAAMPPATVYRILRTLNSAGWIYQDNNDKYLNGSKIFSMSRRSIYAALKEIAYYPMKRYSFAEHQALNLAVRIAEKCFILQQARTEKIVDYVPPLGAEMSLYGSACGKVLLAELPEMELEAVLREIEFKKLTDHTITQKNVFLTELQTVRQNGYALDRHESFEQGNCIALPVRNEAGQTIAALSFSGFIGDFTAQEVEYYDALLKEAAREISQKYFNFWQESQIE
jgi:DNA-binding IclR family transcriptional regulator